jgi:outer membrane protein OmpA-like peptidoglycan-associated protein
MATPLKLILASMVAAALTLAQAPAANQAPPATTDPAPIFRVEVVARTTQAVNYLHRGGSTKIDFQGTPLMARSKGSAKVESERGVIHVTAEFKDLDQPNRFGPEYLTYVLWAISPDGRPVNLGELTLDKYGAGSSSKIETTSDIQTFGMIVTAEPYYGVTKPSDAVVMENVVRSDTRGVIEAIDARYELLPRGTYTMQGKATGFVPVQVGKKDPFELYEAENAVALARLQGADKYAPESFEKADSALQQAEHYQNQKPGQKPVITMAREAVVRAEDSRVVALKREQQEQFDKERQASLDRENAEKERAESARLKAEEESRRRDQAEMERAAAERSKAEAQAAAQQAQLDKQQAEAAKRDAEAARKEAEAARQAALVQQQQLTDEAEKARTAASEADRLRQRAEQDQAQLRQQLLDQFNVILRTRDTARGLIVNLSDVLFDSAKYSLRPLAREKLAKVSGIVLGHPGLKIEVEGHTDSVGGDEYNMKLSEERANAVRAYLLSQGINPDNLSARGFGKSVPVADNGTAAGRQANRRVELVISGEIIGTSITAPRTTMSAPR